MLIPLRTCRWQSRGIPTTRRRHEGAGYAHRCAMRTMIQHWEAKINDYNGLH
jgi:hypothetical protein